MSFVHPPASPCFRSAPSNWLSGLPALLAALGCAGDPPGEAAAVAGRAGQAGQPGGGSSVDGGSSSAGATSGAGRADGGNGSGGADAQGGAAGVTGQSAARPPNVVVIVADDLGYSDLGSFGGEIKTPNLDGLAESGLRFTNFYNASRCSPTRASLLTGQYPHRVNLAANGRDLGRNGLTIAEGLADAGYNTALAGKWHLSRTPELPNGSDHMAWLNHQLDPGVPFSPDVTSYPVGRGFQHHYGPIWGVANYWDPFSLVDGESAIPSVPAGFYLTRAIGQKAVEYIEDFSAQPKPFFIYVAFTAPHWPLHALPEDIAKYEGVYDAGWGPIRAARYARQLELGLFEAGDTPLPATMGNDWSGLSDAQRLYLSGAMQTHAAMVDRVDQSVGEILGALDRSGSRDNTLILFLSDNGASSEIYLQPGFDRPSETRAGDAIVYCGGQASCSYSQPGGEKTWSYLGPSWANAANTPFRHYKGDSFRGGNNTPFIVQWPAGLKTAPGSVTQQPAHVIDVLPTLLELAHVDYPTSHDGHELTSLDGTSLLPIIEGGQRPPHERLFFEHEGGAALIEGSHKLVRLAGSNTWELYDLAADRTETTNLAGSDAPRLQAMTSIWQAWYDSVPH